MSRPNLVLRPWAGPCVAGLLGVAALSAAACGSGTGGSEAQVSIRGLVHRTGCPTSAPRDGPYRGAIVFLGGGGRRSVARMDLRGSARVTLTPGRYRVVVAGRPGVRGLVRARLNGRALPVAAGGRFPVTVRRGNAFALRIVVAVGPTDCNASGAAG